MGVNNNKQKCQGVCVCVFLPCRVCGVCMLKREKERRGEEKHRVVPRHI